MDTLADNTSIHGLLRLASEGNRSQPLSLAEVHLALWLAEYLLFSESVQVTTSPGPKIRGLTEEMLGKLRQIGLVEKSGARDFFRMLPYSEEAYRLACEEASTALVGHLATLGLKDLEVLGQLSDASTRPEDVPTLLKKWVTSEMPLAGRREMLDLEIEGSVSNWADYMIAYNEDLYGQLQRFRCSGETAELVANALLVLFRAALNQCFAGQNGAFYSPAPSRVRVFYEADRTARHALTRKALDEAKLSGKAELIPRLVAALEDHERLPLPIFALHYLRKTSATNPLGLLEELWRMRQEDSGLAAFRTWLSQKEKVQLYGTAEHKAALYAEFDQLVAELGVDLRKEWGERYSLVTFGPSEQVEKLKMSLDLERLWRTVKYVVVPTFRKRRLFLVKVVQDLLFDEDLGRELVRSLGRPMDLRPGR